MTNTLDTYARETGHQVFCTFAFTGVCTCRTRLLVTGPRDWPDPGSVGESIAHVLSVVTDPIVLVHGACPTGVDAYAASAAKRLALVFDLAVEAHPAKNHPYQNFGDWPGCGPRRNQYMASLGAWKCLAFVQPCSRPACGRKDPHMSHGTASCIRFAESAGIPVEKIRL